MVADLCRARPGLGGPQVTGHGRGGVGAGGLGPLSSGPRPSCWLMGDVDGLGLVLWGWVEGVVCHVL